MTSATSDLKQRKSCASKTVSNACVAGHLQWKIWKHLGNAHTNKYLSLAWEWPTLRNDGDERSSCRTAPHLPVSVSLSDTRVFANNLEQIQICTKILLQNLPSSWTNNGPCCSWPKRTFVYKTAKNKRYVFFKHVPVGWKINKDHHSIIFRYAQLNMQTGEIF